MIRHGVTQSNKEHRYLGRTDEPLSAEGRKALQEYKRRQCYPAVDLLFASPMQRCLQTAEILYPDLEPVCIAEWTETDFGAFEGKSFMELQEDKRYQKWIDSNGALPFPDGESREDFMARCEKGFRKMITMTGQTRVLAGEISSEAVGPASGIIQETIPGTSSGMTVGMVVHGGTIMALMSSYGGGDYFDYQVPNGKGYICLGKNLDLQPEFVMLKKI